jgi:hypothetical protein
MDTEAIIGRIKSELGELQVRSDDSNPNSPLVSVVMDFGVALYPGVAATLMETINMADEDMYANKIARKENLKKYSQGEERTER